MYRVHTHEERAALAEDAAAAAGRLGIALLQHSPEDCPLGPSEHERITRERLTLRRPNIEAELFFKQAQDAAFADFVEEQFGLPSRAQYQEEAWWWSVRSGRITDYYDEKRELRPVRTEPLMRVDPGAGRANEPGFREPVMEWNVDRRERALALMGLVRDQDRDRFYGYDMTDQQNPLRRASEVPLSADEVSEDAVRPVRAEDQDALEEGLRPFLADLTEKQRIVIRAHDFDGMSFRDISDMLGSRTARNQSGSAQSNRDQAVRTLRKRLTAAYASAEVPTAGREGGSLTHDDRAFYRRAVASPGAIIAAAGSSFGRVRDRPPRRHADDVPDVGGDLRLAVHAEPIEARRWAEADLRVMERWAAVDFGRKPHVPELDLELAALALEIVFWDGTIMRFEGCQRQGCQQPGHGHAPAPERGYEGPKPPRFGWWNKPRQPKPRHRYRRLYTAARVPPERQAALDRTETSARSWSSVLRRETVSRASWGPEQDAVRDLMRRLPHETSRDEGAGWVGLPPTFYSVWEGLLRDGRGRLEAVYANPTE